MNTILRVFLLPVCFCVHLCSIVANSYAEAPTFLVRKANGTEIRAPLASVDKDFRIEVGTKILRKLNGTDWLSLRQSVVPLPAMPSEEQLVLSSGDRIPARELRLDDEKLRFRHPDLEGNKDSVVPVGSVAMIWRIAPDGTVDIPRYRNRLLRGKRKRDVVLLRNGDTIEGTLNALSAEQVEVEVARKNVVTKWVRVSAVILSTDLTEKARPKGGYARLVLSSTDRSPGGRVTVVAPECDGATFSARTTFGSLIHVPLSRVVSLESSGSHVVHLSDLPSAKYTYAPYLDETFTWMANTNAFGRDLLLGESTYDKGIGLHADSRISYALSGKYRRFDALVGLDDRNGRGGTIRIRLLLDGKPVDLGKTEWKRGDGAVRISVSVAEAKEMTLVVEASGEGPIQGVVDIVEARLILEVPASP